MMLSTRLLRRLYLIYYPFSILIFTIVLTQCEINPTESEKMYNISIQVLEVGCKDALLKIDINNGNSNDTLLLTRNDSILIWQGVLISDTLYWDENLMPNHQYTWQISKKKTLEKSWQTTAVTYDTTNYHFSWEMFEFGEKSGSHLTDIAIVDENDVWAVGDIYTEESYTYDSLGRWILPHNAVHWDGNKWEMKQILWDGNYSKLRTVYAFSTNDIWFGNINLYHWNGFSFNQVDIPDDVFLEFQNKLFGFDSDNIYIVGSNGGMAKYSGSSWHKIQTNTDEPLQDIDGIREEIDNTSILFVCGSSKLSPTSEDQFFVLNNDIPISIPIQSDRNFTPYGIWMESLNRLWLSGSYIAEYKTTGKWQISDFGIPAFVEDIDGNSNNEIYACGHFGLLIYFNGRRWNSIGVPGLYDVIFYTIKAKGNQVWAVGYNTSNRKAVVIKIDKE